MKRYIMFDKEKPSEQLKVEVYYTKGGDHSYVSSNSIPRGLKLSFTKVEIADTGSGGFGASSVFVCVGSGGFWSK